MNKDGKAKIFFGLLSLFIPLVVYLKTLCPTIYMGDSGEMVAAVYSLGIPHPAGYPVYNLLGKAFTLIFPIGSVAYRMNLFSAVFASLTSFLIYFIMLKIFKRFNSGFNSLAITSLALSTALILAFSQIFWERAVTGKAYTLQTFFMAVLFLLILNIDKKAIKERSVSLFILFFLLGLSVGVHITTILFLPAFLILVLLHHPGILLEPKRVIGYPLFFSLGLSVYLYVPLRAAQNPPINWGDPSNLSNFISFITLRGAVRSFISFPEVPETSNILYSLFKIFLEQMPLIFLCIGGIGFIYILKRDFKLFLFLFFMFVPYTIFFARFVGPLMNREHFIPSLFLLTIWIGIGQHSLLKVIQKSKRMAALLSLSFLILPAFLLVKNYTFNDRSSDYQAYDYGRNILESMEANGVIFARGDVSVFPLYYLQIVEKIRPDVRMICVNFLETEWYLKGIEKEFPSLSGRLFPDQPRSSIYEITKILIKTRPVYLDVIDPLAPPGFVPMPNGIIYRLYEKDTPTLRTDLWAKYKFRGITHENFLKSPYHSILFRIYADAHYNAGGSYQWEGMISEAEREYEKAIDMEIKILGGFNGIKEMDPSYFDFYPDRRERFINTLYSLSEIYRNRGVHPERTKEILEWINRMGLSRKKF